MYTITVSSSSLLTIRPYNVVGRTKYTNTITHRHEDVRDRRLPVTCRPKVLSYWWCGAADRSRARSLAYIFAFCRKITGYACLLLPQTVWQTGPRLADLFVFYCQIQSLGLRCSPLYSQHNIYLFPPHTLSTGFLVFN